MTEVFSELYYQGFESLQSNSDEKQVYIATLTNYLGRFGVQSLLDIGAGNGEVAIPISEQVDEYVAVEQSPEYSARIRDAGRKVVEGLFPTHVEGKFDMVLMSHVISHITGNYQSLIPPAWNLVKPEGHLVVVTHRGTEADDWSKLLESIDLGYSERSTNRLNELLAELSGYGQTDIEYVTTNLRTPDIQQMLKAMAFLAASGGKAQFDRFMAKSNTVSHLLRSNFRTEEGYSFPFIHPFIRTKKEP